MMLKFRALIFLMAFTSAAFSKDFTFGEIKSKLLNSEVIINGHPFDLGILKGKLGDWEIYEGDDSTGYRVKKLQNSYVTPYASENIRGMHGQVVSVEIADLKNRKNETDAFGQKVDESKMLNPSVQLVVKLLENNELVGTRNYYINLITGSLTLGTDYDNMRRVVERELGRLNGKTLYNNGNTKLYNSNITLDELSDPGQRTGQLDRATKNLTPMKMVDWKFLEKNNAVIVKVQLPDATERIIYGDLMFFNRPSSIEDKLLDKMNMAIYDAIPKKFSLREINAIRDGVIYGGMSEDGLFWSWGYPKSTNDWGRGGYQYIYGSGQYVYVSGKVIKDFQSVK